MKQKLLYKDYVKKIITAIIAILLTSLFEINIVRTFQLYNNYSYIVVGVCLVIIFFSIFLFISNAIPFFIKIVIEKEWKKVIAIVGISIVLTISIISLRQWMIVQKNTIETVDLFQDTVIEQKLYFQNTKDLVLYCLIPQESIDDNCFIIATIAQDDFSEDIIINLNCYQSDFWDFIHLNTENFKNGDVSLTITGGNLQDNHVTFQLAIGNQHIDLNSVMVNGEIQTGKVLLLRYKYINCVAAARIWLIFLCICVFAFWLYSCLKEYLKNNIIIVISFALIIIISIQNNIYAVPLNGWCVTPWLLSYKYGFISRALPGTIMLLMQKMITGSAYITENDLRSVFIILLTVLCIFIVHWIGKMLRENKRFENGKYYNSIKNISLLYILSPIFVTFYCYSNRLGRLDVILIICFVTCCSLIIKRKWLFLVPVLTVIAILTHQIFIFTLLPVVLAMMFYCWLGENDSKFSVPSIITLCFDALFGVYCQFFANIDGWTFKEVMVDMQRKTNTPLLELMVSSEQYFSTQMFTDYYMDNYVDFAVIFKYIWFIILCLPIYYIYIQVWKNSIRLMYDKKKKFWMLIIAISPICVLPIFFTVALDFGRWTAEYGTAAFFGIFMMIRKNNYQVLQGIKTVNDKISIKMGKDWPFYCGILFVLLGYLDDAQGFGIMSQLKQSAEVFLKVIGY